MDVEYVVRRSFPGPGGIAQMLRTVATELARDHRVRVWASRIDDAAFTRTNTTVGARSFEPVTEQGVEVVPLPRTAGVRAAAAPIALTTVPLLRGPGFALTRRITAPAYVRRLGAELSRAWGEPDVVHCWGGEPVNWAGGDGARRSGARLVVTPFAHPGAWGDDDMNATFYRTADAVIALLPTEAAFYETLGVDAGRLHVSGVPVTPRGPAGPDVRSAHDLGDDPLVLFLGVKQPYKGYRTLLEAAVEVWRTVPRARFAFVGPQTAASREDFGIVADDRVIEQGLVPEEEVGAWLRAATVLCLPSTSEIMPVSILEAWSEGVPVVAARWWCADDLIDHETDGLVVEPSSGAIARALVSLLRDGEGLRAMGEAGRAKVGERYSPAAVAARHLAAYTT